MFQLKKNQYLFAYVVNNNFFEFGLRAFSVCNIMTWLCAHFHHVIFWKNKMRKNKYILQCELIVVRYQRYLSLFCLSHMYSVHCTLITFSMENIIHYTVSIICFDCVLKVARRDENGWMYLYGYEVHVKVHWPVCDTAENKLRKIYNEFWSWAKIPAIHKSSFFIHF